MVEAGELFTHRATIEQTPINIAFSLKNVLACDPLVTAVQVNIRLIFEILILFLEVQEAVKLKTQCAEKIAILVRLYLISCVRRVLFPQIVNPILLKCFRLVQPYLLDV